MNYSFNIKTDKVVFSGLKDINASFKDMAAVCDYIRYKNAAQALQDLQKVIDGEAAVRFRTNNKGMGSRHELGGMKGRYPMKCAAIARKVLSVAMSNAKAKGYNGEDMFVVHAAANKTQINRRTPSKGMLYHSDSYGYGTLRHSDLEFAKLEIGIALPEDIKLGTKAMRIIERNKAMHERMSKNAKKAKDSAKTKSIKEENPKGKPAKEKESKKQQQEAAIEAKNA